MNSNLLILVNRVFICVVIVCITLYSFSQTQLRTDIIPHSPEAESIAKYVTTPVTLYEGTAAISIPIYEIKSSQLSLPINLTYNYNGYRPVEQASWVGLGWNLAPGGGITRIVKGKVDEDITVLEHCDDYVDITALSNKQLFLRQAGTGQIDLEPDLYIFNFNGYSGKFTMIKGNPVMYPHQDLKIEESGSVGNERFVITTEDGTIYTFDDRETTSSGHTDMGAAWIPDHTSAWFLSKIESADRTDIITFSYSTYSHTQQMTFSETYSILPITASGTSAHHYSSTGFVGGGVTSKQLGSISSKTCTISFELEGSARQDLLNNNAKALRSIHVYSGSGLSRNVNLVHSYFVGNSASGFRNTKLNLKEVDLSCIPIPNGGPALPETIFGKYLFQYQNETGGFPVQKKGIDYWGYYNGVDGNQSLFPNGFITPSLTIVGNRDANPATCVNGCLSKITYPTGGFTLFTYEPNSFVTNVSTANNLHIGVPYNAAIGNPTSETRSFTIPTDQAVSISYGRVIDQALYPYGVKNVIKVFEIFKTAGNILVYASNVFGPGTLNSTPGTSIFLRAGDYYYKVTCESTSISSYGDIIFYSGNWINKPVGGMRIAQTQSFDNLNQTTAAIIKNYIYNDDLGKSTAVQLAGPTLGSQQIRHSGGCQPSNVELDYFADYNSSLNGLLEQQFYYSRVTEVNNNVTGSGQTIYEFQSDGTDVGGVYLKKQTEQKFTGTGLITIKTTENSFDAIIKSVTNAYKSQLYESKDQTGVNCADGTYLIGIDADDPANRSQLYQATGLYGLPSIYKLLNNTLETIYDQNGLNPIVKQVNYYYDNPLFQFPTRKVEKNSKGEEITTQMKYPFDYDYSGCGTIGTIEAGYVSDKQNAINTYNTCVSNRAGLLTSNHLYPYYPNNPTNQASFTNIINGNPCEQNFKTSSASIYLSRNNAYSSYYNCLGTAYTNNTIPSQRSILLMQKNHIMSPVIEQYSTIKKAGIENLISATKTDYKIKTTVLGVDIPVPNIVFQTELAAPILKTNFLNNPSTFYKPQLFYSYDGNINLKEQHKNNDISTIYLWDYQSVYPVAEVTNATSADTVAHTSFEADGHGNFVFNGTAIVDNSAPTGKMVYPLSTGNSITKVINPLVAYVISMWAKNSSGVFVNSQAASKIGSVVNGWTYLEWTVTGQTNLMITAGNAINIDELRLYPAGSSMNTYTYTQGVGMTTKCDSNNIVTYYDYDSFGRLALMRDQDKNIIKKYAYNYSGMPENTGQ
jgi:hypothetical protein